METTVNALRASLSSIPGSLSNFISENATVASNYLQSANSSSTSTQSAISTPSPPSTITTVTDESLPNSDNKSLPIPASLVKEQWRLIFTSDAIAQDLEAAIAHCRDLVLLTDECSDERRWLVRHLVDLRYSLNELQAAQVDPLESGPSIKTVVGHHFMLRQSGRLQAATKRYYCDHCTGIIWSVVQCSYSCTDCQFLAHQKCVDSVVRICAHVTASERQYPIVDICPEIGLAAQRYKCDECGTLLNYKNSWVEPRLCDYSGLYYCPSCHWNDSSIIPARIIHNWDFTARKVARVSLQEIKLFLDKPLIKLEEANAKLFVFLEKLSTLKKLRRNLVYMRKYLVECRRAVEDKLLETQIGTRRHLVQSHEYYSINDLEQTECGALAEFLHRVYKVFEEHIRKCELCEARAYRCEICQNYEVIYPFDDGCIMCEKCNSICHRVCMTRKNMICPKCVRLKERKLQLESAANAEPDDD